MNEQDKMTLLLTFGVFITIILIYAVDPLAALISAFPLSVLIVGAKVLHENLERKLGRPPKKGVEK